MSLLPPDALDRLSRSRLRLESAAALRDVGERTGSDVGAGVEFSDHRAYQPGDDVRHLDVRAYARLRTPYVRQYHPPRPVEVEIVIDGSASMAFGEPTKSVWARRLAMGIACLALAGEDRVRVHLVSQDGPRSSSWLRGMTELDAMGQWLEDLPCAGTCDVAGALRTVRAASRSPRLLVLLSDLWDERLDLADLRRAALGGSTVVLHVLSPAELDPPLVPGEYQLRDGESGGELGLTIDVDLLERYRHALAAHRDGLRETVTAAGGRFAGLSSGRPVLDTIFRDLPRASIVR